MSRPHYVYVLWEGEEVVYVGRTINLPQRLGVFRRRTGLNPAGQYYPFAKLADAQAEEIRLITTHRPRFNKYVASSPTRLGQRNSEKQNANISRAMRGKRLSAEHRANLWAHRTHKCRRGPDGRFLRD